jgi:hypothetical protein
MQPVLITDTQDYVAYNETRNSVWYRTYQAVWVVYPTRKKTGRFHAIVSAIENKDAEKLERLIVKYRMSYWRDKLNKVYSDIWS